MTMGLISAGTFVIFAFLFFITTPRFYLATLSSFSFYCRHGLGETMLGLGDGGGNWRAKLGGDCVKNSCCCFKKVAIIA